MPSPRTRAELAFTGRFESKPKGVVFAPGRVNLIGEHVDHQGGWVLPLALKLGIAAAYGPRPDRTIRIVALDERARDRFALGGKYVKSGQRWADLARGCCAVVEARGGRVPSLDLVIAGDLPARRGLGSSAAFLTSILKAFAGAVNRPPPPPQEIAEIVQEVEATWGGARCGVMDPYVSALGGPGRPVLIDCLEVQHETLPWPDGFEAVPHDTGVERNLSDTPYNERRHQLEAGLARVRALRPSGKGLRDLTPELYLALEADVPEPARRRVRHAVTEVARVRRAAEALRRGDAEELGRVLDEGHQSLTHDFECSTPAIDALAATIRAEEGVLGVRLQGAGWGGSLVVLRKERPPPPEPDEDEGEAASTAAEVAPSAAPDATQGT